MKMCWNKNVIIGLVAVAMAVYFLAPGSIGAALPVLLLAACPLSMVLMMRAMAGDRSTTTNAAGGAVDNSTSEEVARLRAEVAELRRTASTQAPGAPGSRSDSDERFAE